MHGLVLAGGYLTLLIVWELVGAASARLIAYGRLALHRDNRRNATTSVATVAFGLAAERC